MLYSDWHVIMGDNNKDDAVKKKEQIGANQHWKIIASSDSGWLPTHKRLKSDLMNLAVTKNN